MPYYVLLLQYECLLMSSSIRLNQKFQTQKWYGYYQKHAFLAVLAVVHKMCRIPRVKNWFQKFYDVNAKKYNEIKLQISPVSFGEYF